MVMIVFEIMKFCSQPSLPWRSTEERA